MYAKIIKWLSYTLMVASIVIAAICVVNGFATESVDPLTGQTIQEPSFFTSLLLYWGYGMFILPVLIIVLCGIALGLKNNPKGLVVLAGGLVALAAVVLLAFLIAPGTAVTLAPGTEATETTFKLADTALYVTYFALAGVVLSLLAGGCYRLIKR